jgi:hypothetical protein
MDQERYWARRSFPGWQRMMLTVFASGSTKKAVAKSEQRFKNQEEKSGKLLITLAAHAYELDNGHKAASTGDLVPNYLKAVPVDPATGSNMTYLP